MSRRGEGYFPNQSLNGLLNRLLRNGNNLEWMGASFAPYHPWVFWPTAISSALLVAAALAPPPAGQRGDAVDFSLLALTVTVASPIAWEHHYGILPPIYAATLAAVVVRPALGAAGLPLLAASFALTSNELGFTNRLATTNWNVLQSYLYVGALLLLLLLHRLRRPPRTGRRHRMKRAATRPGAVALVAFGASLALYFGVGQALAPGRMFERADLALGADVPRVIADLTRFEANHYRTKVHPLFVILLNPPGAAAQGAARRPAAGGAAAERDVRRAGRRALPRAAAWPGRRRIARARSGRRSSACRRASSSSARCPRPTCSRGRACCCCSCCSRGAAQAAGRSWPPVSSRSA